MATFYVGQRVRVVRSERGLAGKEATVTALSVSAKWEDGTVRDGCIRVMVDGERSDGPEGAFACPASWLEPLTLPPQLIAWQDACFDRGGKYKVGAAA